MNRMRIQRYCDYDERLREKHMRNYIRAAMIEHGVPLHHRDPDGVDLAEPDEGWIYGNENDTDYAPMLYATSRLYTNSGNHPRKEVTVW